MRGRMLGRERDRLRVDRTGLFDVVAVATGHHDRDRDAEPTRDIEHTPITCGQALERQIETAKTVAAIGICTGEIEDEVGREPLEHRIERAVERGEIASIVAAIRQADIEIARFLAERKFFSPCNDSVKTSLSSARIFAVPLP